MSLPIAFCDLTTADLARRTGPSYASKLANNTVCLPLSRGAQQLSAATIQSESLRDGRGARAESLRDDGGSGESPSGTRESPRSGEQGGCEAGRSRGGVPPRRVGVAPRRAESLRDDGGSGGAPPGTRGNPCSGELGGCEAGRSRVGVAPRRGGVAPRRRGSGVFPRHR